MSKNMVEPIDQTMHTDTMQAMDPAPGPYQPVQAMDPAPGPYQPVIAAQPVQQTVVVVTGAQGGIPTKSDWTTGQMACCDDMGICLLGCFCPEILMCKIAWALDETCCVPMFVPGGLMAMRTKLRTMYNIRGSICGDFLSFNYLGMLPVCQLARELKYRGLY